MRRYDEPVEVRRGLVDGQEAPEQFLWRARLYLVRGVLASWVETGAWWSAPAARGVYGVEPADAAGRDARASPAGSLATSSLGAAVGAVTVLDDDERELWRVEAAAGRSSPPGVFDLALVWSTGRWVLVGTHD
jgi:hypothetical protein